MPLRTYRLTSTNTAGGAGAAGVALTTITGKGRIVGISWLARALGGAADGFYSIECALNNPTLSQAETPVNAPSEQLLARFALTVDSGETDYANGYIPFDRQVVQGNTLAINQSQSGTAAASALFGFDVYVMEN